MQRRHYRYTLRTMMRRHRLSVLALVLALSGCATVADREHRQLALSELYRAADQGMAEAQYQLARAYGAGVEGVPRDLAESLRWFRLAADQGHPLAARAYRQWTQGERAEQLTAAAMAAQDRGGARGRRLAEELAAAGVADAQYFLGKLLLEGDGVSRSREHGLEWMRRAADQGHSNAEYVLGVAHAGGHGRERDLRAARGLWQRCAEAGHAGCQYALGVTLIRGDGGEADWPRGSRWLRRAAEQGHARAEATRRQLLARLP